MKNIIKKKKGFTLVEVIIVLAIIAIIAAIAIPNLTKVRTDSKIKADQQSCETIRRTTIMLLTDDSLRVDKSSDKYINFTFVNGKVSTIKGDVVAGPGSTLTDYEDYFTEIKQPQQDGRKNYLIIVDTNGEVKVQTHEEENPLTDDWVE